jgi:hypothetical protein
MATGIYHGKVKAVNVLKNRAVLIQKDVLSISPLKLSKFGKLSFKSGDFSTFTKGSEFYFKASGSKVTSIEELD